jgi:hypothetical protein
MLRRKSLRSYPYEKEPTLRNFARVVRELEDRDLEA